jgi:uncharacterized cofD-like protein
MSYNIVAIGGGNGLSNLLSALQKEKDFKVSAVVSTMDSGGSTGIIRKEHNVIAFGDLRRALAAMSENKELKKEFNYRYKKGINSGHTAGNLFLLNLTQKFGSEKKAVAEAHKILQIKGEVIPVTYIKTNIVAVTKSGKKIVGETNIDTAQKFLDIKKINLVPSAKANKQALKALEEADIVLIGPGDLYTSVLCNFAVLGLKEALKRSKAKKIWINNLTNKISETKEFRLKNYLEEIDKYIGLDIIDYVLYQEKPIGQDPILDKGVTGVKGKFIGDDFAMKKDSIYLHNVKKIIKYIRKLKANS